MAMLNNQKSVLPEATTQQFQIATRMRKAMTHGFSGYQTYRPPMRVVGNCDRDRTKQI